MKRTSVGNEIILIFLIFCFFIPKVALARGGYWGGYGMGPGMMGGWGMGWFGGIFMMAFWVLLIVALVFFIRWLIRSSGRAADGVAGRSRAIEILKERYARGEIDAEEFEERRLLLLS